VRIAHDHRNFGHRGEFVRRSLCVAAGDYDPRAGVRPVNAADDLPHLVIGRRGNRACVQDHEMRVSGVRRLLESAVRKQRFDSCAIGLRCAASEILNEELCGRAHYLNCIGLDSQGRHADPDAFPQKVRSFLGR
jgi:hypothetical protein